MVYGLWQLNNRQIKSMIQLPNKEISNGSLYLSVPLVQRRPREERCDGQIVMILTFVEWFTIAARATIKSPWIHSSDLGIASVTCTALCLYYMIIVELSRYTDFRLFNSRNTAHQLVTSMNSKYHLVFSRKQVNYGRANFNEIVHDLIKQKEWPPKKIVLRLKKKNFRRYYY